MTNPVLEVIFKGTDQTLSKTAEGIGGSFGKLGGAVKAGLAIGITAAVGLGTAAVGLGAQLIGLGSDAEEMQSKFNVVFANVGGEVTSALDEFAAAAGRSKFELRGYAATLGDTLKPMGFSEEAAGDLSVQLVELATDLGSFNNMSMDEALQRLQGTLIGSHENALAFGVVINENTLKAELAANGWDKLTGSELEAAKVQARINLLMAGTTDAQGDAIRTADGWANSTRALVSKIKDFGTELGMKLLPIFTPLLNKISTLADEWLPKIGDIITGSVIPAIQGIITAFSSFFDGVSEGQGIVDNFALLVWDLAENVFGVGHDRAVELYDSVLNIGNSIIETKDKIVEFITPITDWITQNIELKDVLVALGIVLGGIVLSALVSLVAAVAPVLAAGAALIGIVALVRTAWENDWGGIQEKVAMVVAWFQETLVPWFQENIPIAIQFLSDAWTNVLQPAIQTVWDWLTNVLVPFITDVLVPWLQTNIPAAIEILRGFWEETLLPAIKNVWTFLTVDMMPIWEALGTLMEVTVGKAIEALTGIWQNILLPAMTAVHDYIMDNIGPAFQWLLDHVISPVSGAFDTLAGKIGGVAQWISNLATQLSNLELPDWMTPGSPTPWEIGLVGVRMQLQSLARNDVPAFSSSLQGLQSSVQRNTTVNQTTNIYTSSVDTRGESQANMRFATGGI